MGAGPAIFRSAPNLPHRHRAHLRRSRRRTRPARPAVEGGRGGRRRVALSAGEPGVGKTRLAAELARRVHDEGARVLDGRCDEELACRTSHSSRPCATSWPRPPSSRAASRPGRGAGPAGARARPGGVPGVAAAAVRRRDRALAPVRGGGRLARGRLSRRPRCSCSTTCSGRRAHPAAAAPLCGPRGRAPARRRHLPRHRAADPSARRHPGRPAPRAAWSASALAGLDADGVAAFVARLPARPSTKAAPPSPGTSTPTPPATPSSCGSCCATSSKPAPPTDRGPWSYPPPGGRLGVPEAGPGGGRPPPGPPVG